jgi:phage N-6-adenine-methyltransferase
MKPPTCRICGKAEWNHTCEGETPRKTKAVAPPTQEVATVSIPGSLPALVELAANRLLGARSSAEVLEARKLADMALHYAKVTQAANETHADCLRIITRAEIRMAGEIDRGREAGEVATHGGDRRSTNVRASDIDPVTLDDLGIPRQRAAEWRDLRDAGGEEVVERAIDSALAEGRAPTKADIAAEVHNHRAQGTGENEWYTPAAYIAAVRRVLGGIDLDPTSSAQANGAIGAVRFFSLEDDGLAQEWGGRVWMNPPYSQPAIAMFIDKLVDEFEAGRVEQAIALTHNYTDTAWFHRAAGAAQAICFTRGRIAFEAPDGRKAAPTQGQAFFYFGDDVPLFIEVFEEIGFVVVPHGV